jgi:hypothetical protein
MIRNTRKRILALEIRRHRFGFAVLEGRKRLLEYGAGSYTSRSSILPFLNRIIATFKPEMIVVRRLRQRNLSDRRATVEALKQVRTVAEERAIPIENITNDEVRLAFQQDAPRNKDGIAAAVAKIFPELRWKLPKVRKPWMSESYHMIMFDAVASAITIRMRHETKMIHVEAA